MSKTLRNLWQWWKRVAVRVGDYQARIILTLFYFVVFAPFALVVRLATDPLSLKKGRPRGWQLRERDESTSMEWARRQF